MTSSTYHEVSKTKSSSHLGFDWAVVTLSLWMVAGVHLDAWAHHRFASTLEPPGLPTPLCLGHTCAFLRALFSYAGPHRWHLVARSPLGGQHNNGRVGRLVTELYVYCTED